MRNRNHLFLLWFIFILSASNTYLVAQKSEKKSKKRGKGDKKEQVFNPIQEMGGSHKAEMRDDYIWGINTAFTLYKGASDIGITSQTRYGLNPRMELSSNILLCTVTPNIFLKYQISKGKIWIASRHGVYFPSMGLKMTDNKGYILPTSDSLKVPFIGVIRNELILSYPFYNKTSCNSTQPYLIISVFGGLDYGFSGSKWEATGFTKPWLEPRKSSLLANGATIHFTGRVDYMMLYNFKLEAELGALNDNLSSLWALENRVIVKYFPYSNLSLSLGWMLSISNKATSPQLGILPLFDITLYFGTKQNRMKGLWDQKMN